MSFTKASSGSEMESAELPFGEVWASPNAPASSIPSPSFPLSLGGLLSSRARLCFTGRQESKPTLGGVNPDPIRRQANTAANINPT